MSRRSTPEPLDAAWHPGVRNRLIAEGATEETADAWLAAWEAQAAQDGLARGAAYWQAGCDWIAEQRGRRVRPWWRVLHGNAVPGRTEAASRKAISKVGDR